KAPRDAGHQRAGAGQGRRTLHLFVRRRAPLRRPANARPLCQQPRAELQLVRRCRPQPADSADGTRAAGRSCRSGCVRRARSASPAQQVQAAAGGIRTKDEVLRTKYEKRQSFVLRTSYFCMHSAITQFLRFLGVERNAAPLTIKSYREDLTSLAD